MALLLARQKGYVKFDLPCQANIYEVQKEATIGVPYIYEFSSQMIPFLGPESNTAAFTFYYGSEASPPAGINLKTDGTLMGTPSAKGGAFVVCVKDNGGKSVCMTFHLTVNSANDVLPSNCPTKSNPPCHSVNNGIGVEGVIVYDYCQCPSDTTYSGTTDRVTPGGPYKICNCN